MPCHIDLVEAMLDNGLNDIEQIGPQKRQDDLCFRVPESGIEL
jgi:hypothetical protein